MPSLGSLNALACAPAFRVVGYTKAIQKRASRSSEDQLMISSKRTSGSFRRIHIYEYAVYQGLAFQ